MDKRLVAIVQERANGYCEVCGRAAEESMALHHRKLKSRGGKDSAANLISIHHGCHNMKTGSVHLNPEWAEQNGYMTPSWQDPTEHPVNLCNAGFALLLDDGSIRYLEREGARE